MFVDLPPGTTDPQLTVFQSIPLMGIIVVTSPQELVSVIVEKAMNMAKKIQIPVIGIVENYSYFIAPDTKKKYNIFGESKTKNILEKNNVDLLDEIPLDQNIAKKMDLGKVEEIEQNYLDNTIAKILEFYEDGK